MTREIPLTKGQVAIVDDEDYEYLSQFKWQAFYHRKTYYAVRHSKGVGKSGVQMHREIMGAAAGVQVDHRDRNGLHNWRGNLRFCTNAQNLANRGPNKNNKSGYKGVGWDRAKKKWCARIKVNRKTIYLGRYHGIQEAARAYDEAAKEYFGEFTWMNFNE